MSYRHMIDDALSTYCESHGIEYSTLHCEAFCITDPNMTYSWLYLWYDEDNSIEDYIKEIKQIYNGVKEL